MLGLRVSLVEIRSEFSRAQFTEESCLLPSWPTRVRDLSEVVAFPLAQSLSHAFLEQGQCLRHGRKLGVTVKRHAHLWAHNMLGSVVTHSKAGTVMESGDPNSYSDAELMRIGRTVEERMARVESEATRVKRIAQRRSLNCS